MDEQFLIFILLLGISSLSGIAIDNGIIGTPIVGCMPDGLRIGFHAEKDFRGRIYIKGFADNPRCVIKAGQSHAGMALSFDYCGVTRTRQSNPAGIVVTSTVVISFHPTFVTKVDRAYRVNCFYMEVSKTVTNALDVSMLTTQNLDQIPEMPVCRYEILDGSANGLPIKYARIGQPVYHKWTCESGNQMFCMRVHSCAVSDGQESPSVDVIDARGCGVDRYILGNLEYITDLVAGQEAHVFKFADKPALFFNCQIEISLKSDNLSCETVRPQCDEPTVSSAKPRASRSVEMPEFKESFDLPPQRLVVFDLDDIQEGDVQIPIDQGKHDNTDAENQNHNRKQTENLQRQAQEELLDRIIPYDRSLCLNSYSFATVVTVILLLIIMTLFGLVYVATKKRRETSVSSKVERIDG